MILTYPFRLISKDNFKMVNRFGRPFLSNEFKKWEKMVRDFTVLQYRNKPLEGNLYMCITANFTNKKHCDTQNLPKGLCDSYQGLLYKNDSQIKKINIQVNEDSLSDAFEIVIDKI